MLPTYNLTSSLIEALFPAPKRFFQRIIIEQDLRSGLDIGCGRDSILTGVRSSRFKSTGMDVSQRSIDISKSLDRHDSYIVGDFMSEGFSDQFDVVVLSHVIEHFEYAEAQRVLQRIEKIARRAIYIETPYGFLEQCCYDENVFQRHLSGWFPHDFINRGYSVFGSGVRGLTGPMGFPRFFPGPIVQNINRSLQWFYFRRPQYASTISAIRYIDSIGNLRSV